MSEVFRIYKTKDFTVMSNHHLRNTCLTLRAKGLLSLMLSLPPSWDYSLAGLAKIRREGTRAISAAYKAARGGKVPDSLSYPQWKGAAYGY